MYIDTYCYACALFWLSLSFEQFEAAVTGKFIRMYIENSFPIVRNVVQKSTILHSSTCEGTVYNFR